MLRGSTEILETVCGHLGGVKPGETTKDGKFTVIEVECQGACSNAPMMVINDDFYVSLGSAARCFRVTPTKISYNNTQEDLTATSTKAVLDAFSKGKKPKPGPQSGRHTSENSAGLTALTSKASHYFFFCPLEACPSLSLTLALYSHMAPESIACQNFNSTSHRIEWTELLFSSVVQYHLLGSWRIYVYLRHDVMGLWNIYLSAYKPCSFHCSGR